MSLHATTYHGERLGIYGTSWVRWEGEPPGAFDMGQSNRFTIYNGHPDPKDESHFSFDYEMDEGRGTIDGWLRDDGSVDFKIRDGPAGLPQPPAHVQVTILSPTQFRLSWEPVRWAWGYSIERQGLNGKFDRFDTVDAKTTDWYDGFRRSTERLRVRAYNIAGESEPSPEATVSLPP